MGSQILRPTKVKGYKGEWVIQGPWGRRSYVAMSNVGLYEELHRELVAGGLLPARSPVPSRRYHGHVTAEVLRSSWIHDRWVRDEAFASRLRRLREQAGLTQENLADRSGLDVGTIRQLEQGTRTNPHWQTVCALARGLSIDVVGFIGTDGWQPPDPNGDWKRRRERSESHDSMG